MSLPLIPLRNEDESDPALVWMRWQRGKISTLLGVKLLAIGSTFLSDWAIRV